MNRLLLAVALWVGLAGAGFARTVEEQLVATLRAQGYEILEQGYTFLGRLRVLAQNDELRREIVVNPGTGEILRDYAVLLSVIATDGNDVTRLTKTSNSSQGSGGDTTAGMASGVGTASGQPADDAVSATGTGAPFTQPTDGNGMTGDPEAHGVILIDPILPFSVGGQ